MRILLLIILFPLAVVAQSKADSVQLSQRYLEDQFYAGVTYNFVLSQPDLVNQRNFSYGLQAGFIRDLPLNKDRTIGLGIGVGLSLNTYYTNIRAQETTNGVEYSIITDFDFKRSKLETHLLEIPIEFRWRNSDPETYSFWRVYTGIKLGYAFDSRSKFVIDNLKESFVNDDVQKLQYGITMNFGYHNFNIHMYYSLTSLFEDGVLVDEQELGIKPLHIGFVFYFL